MMKHMKDQTDIFLDLIAVTGEVRDLLLKIEDQCRYLSPDRFDQFEQTLNEIKSAVQNLDDANSSMQQFVLS